MSNNIKWTSCIYLNLSFSCHFIAWNKHQDAVLCGYLKNQKIVFYVIVPLPWQLRLLWKHVVFASSDFHWLYNCCKVIISLLTTYTLQNFVQAKHDNVTGKILNIMAPQDEETFIEVMLQIVCNASVWWN